MCDKAEKGLNRDERNGLVLLNCEGSSALIHSSNLRISSFRTQLESIRFAISSNFPANS